MDVPIPKRIAKAVRGALDDIVSEVDYIVSHIIRPDVALRARYNVHIVSLDGEDYFAVDAKAVNRALHQTGRGNFRHIITKDAVYVGVAEHRNNGSYKWVK